MYNVINLSEFALQFTGPPSETEIREFLAILLGALAGSMTSYALLRSREKEKEREEVVKIRSLLKEEFYRLLELTIEVMSHTIDFNNKLTKEEYIKTITSDDKILKQAIKNTILPLKFAYWKSLESSGSLIKLKAREIQLVQSVHDYLEATHNNSEINGLSVWREIDAYFLDMIEPSKRMWITNTLIPYINTSLNICKNTAKVIQTLNEISWINLPNPSNRTTNENSSGKKQVIDSHGAYEWV